MVKITHGVHLREALYRHVSRSNSICVGSGEFALSSRNLHRNHGKTCEGQLNSTLTSSPVKKIVIRTRTTGGVVSGDGGDTSLGRSSGVSNAPELPSSSPYRKRFRVSPPRVYRVDHELNVFLRKYHEEGVVSLGLQDVSFRSSCRGEQDENEYNQSELRAKILYYDTHVEALIEIPKTLNVKRSILILQLRHKLNDKQGGQRRCKVTTFTPRSEAAWFRRKLAEAKLPLYDSYKYIIVKTRKSLVGPLKESLDELL